MKVPTQCSLSLHFLLEVDRSLLAAGLSEDAIGNSHDVAFYQGSFLCHCGTACSSCFVENAVWMESVGEVGSFLGGVDKRDVKVIQSYWI